MSVFGSTPIVPTGPQAGLAAQQAALHPNERGKPAVEAGQRMKDAREHRVAGAESESAVRKVADEHAESDAKGRRRDRRDGRRDAYVASKANDAAATTTADPQRIDRESDGKPRRLDLKA